MTDMLPNDVRSVLLVQTFPEEVHQLPASDTLALRGLLFKNRRKQLDMFGYVEDLNLNWVPAIVTHGFLIPAPNRFVGEPLGQGFPKKLPSTRVFV